MNQPHIIFHLIFLIFFGTAILATIALYTRQSLLVAYIILGAIMGPWGLKLVTNSDAIKQAGEIGIIFLLFLLGLHLNPQSLFHSLRKMSLITLISSIIFFTTGYLLCLISGYSNHASLVIGIATMISRLHHDHLGSTPCCRCKAKIKRGTKLTCPLPLLRSINGFCGC